MQWEDARRPHSSIVYEATEEIQKMLPYFVQDHFLEAENAYDEAADYLSDALNKFTKKQAFLYTRVILTRHFLRQRKRLYCSCRVLNFLSFPISFPNGKISVICSGRFQ